APEVEPRAELAPQDRRVAALAAMGHRDKEIAYMLGCPRARSPARCAAPAPRSACDRAPSSPPRGGVERARLRYRRAMRLFAIAIVLCACGKASPPPPPPAPGSGSGSAAPPPHVVVPDARVGITLPPELRCGGHWSGTIRWDPTQCKSPAPYRDVDVVVRAGADGWEASVAKPTGGKLTGVTVTWDRDETIRKCEASIALAFGTDRLLINLKQDHSQFAQPITDNVELDGACIQLGTLDAQHAPDDGVLPPPPAAARQAAGTYKLSLTWPRPPKCPKGFPALPTAIDYAITIDRDHGDALVAAPLTIGELSLQSDDAPESYDGKVRVRHSGLVDLADDQATYDLVEDLAIAGDKVTGTATLVVANPYGNELCSAEATVTGTFAQTR
ncbi:MAG TPA: hypothetical protein VLX92_16265, partial [Kofleriaceae bacterium]|nr:hypothetical protein [Kofleriaceae bacterium]